MKPPGSFLGLEAEVRQLQSKCITLEAELALSRASAGKEVAP